MTRDDFKTVMREAMGEYFASEDGRRVIGLAVYDAVNAVMMAEIRMEDGKSDPGRVVERIETVNVLHFLARYLPGLEASLRGVQSDAAQARNRAAESVQAIEGLLDVFRLAAYRPAAIDGRVQPRLIRD